MTKITETGIKRSFLIWFFSISLVFITLFSGLINLSDVKYDTFVFACITIIMSILGSKGYDNKQRKEIKCKEMETNNIGNKNE